MILPDSDRHRDSDRTRCATLARVPKVWPELYSRPGRAGSASGAAYFQVQVASEHLKPVSESESYSALATSCKAENCTPSREGPVTAETTGSGPGIQVSKLTSKY